VVTPRKLAYLRRNWLTAVALLLPAARGSLGVVGRANRGMRALGRVMGRRGFGYVAALTVLVTVAGAAGMYEFEHVCQGATWTASAARCGGPRCY